MLIKFYASIGYGNREEIVDVPDDWTDEDIDREFKGWLENFLEYGREKINDTRKETTNER